MMLHVDMALRKNFRTWKWTDEPSCETMDECEDNTETLPFVREFMESQETFHRVLSTAYLKMINKSYTRLTPLE